MNTKFLRVIGVDVASNMLDIDDSDKKIAETMPSTVSAVAKKFVTKIKSRSDTLVVCEATVGYEHVLVDRLVIVFRRPDSFREAIKSAHWDGWP